MVGLDGAKVGVLKDEGKDLAKAVKNQEEVAEGDKDKNIVALDKWWQDAKATAETDKEPLDAAALHGGRQALKLTSYVPATMAVCYLILIMMFKAKGGYKAESVTDTGGSSEASENSSDEDTV